jgi:hypothetical protein
MHCSFNEYFCPEKPNDTACFECDRCKKRIIIMRGLAPRINEVAKSFPPCAKAPQEAAPQPEVAAPQQPQPVAAVQNPSPAQNEWDPAGPGTQLKKLLGKIGIKSTEGCSCNRRAKLMNERGIEWCEQNVGEIVGWLREEASRRGLPFLDMPAKIIINKSIKMAKKIRDSK